MIKKIISLVLIAIAFASSAMEIVPEKAAREVTIIVDEKHQYKVPAEIIEKTGMGPLIHEDKLIIPSGQFLPDKIDLMAQFMKAAYRHKNLKGKALLDAVEKEINPKKIDIISFLRIADYFNYPTATQFAVREIIQVPILLKEATDLKDKGAISQDSFDVIGRIYYLKNNKKIIPGLSKNALQFNVRDYLDYMPHAIVLKPDEVKIDETIHRGYSLDLSKLNLNNLDGLKEINNIDKVMYLYLRENLLTEINDDSFEGADALIGLSLGKNQITRITSQAFAHLTHLVDVGLNDNFITSLPADLFKNNDQLGGVWLTGNQLTHLDKSFFTKKYKLLIVQLSDNKLKTIDPRMFNGISGVRVSLHRNPITEQTKKILNEWNAEHSYIQRIGGKLPSGRYEEDRLPIIEF